MPPVRRPRMAWRRGGRRWPPLHVPPRHPRSVRARAARTPRSGTEPHSCQPAAASAKSSAASSRCPFASATRADPCVCALCPQTLHGSCLPRSLSARAPSPRRSAADASQTGSSLSATTRPRHSDASCSSSNATAVSRSSRPSATSAAVTSDGIDDLRLADLASTGQRSRDQARRLDRFPRCDEHEGERERARRSGSSSRPAHGPTRSARRHPRAARPSRRRGSGTREAVTANTSRGACAPGSARTRGRPRRAHDLARDPRGSSCSPRLP